MTSIFKRSSSYHYYIMVKQPNGKWNQVIPPPSRRFRHYEEDGVVEIGVGVVKRDYN